MSFDRTEMSTKYSSILVIATRLIGDVLLTTPLVHSLRKAYPTAQIDILVFDHTAGVLEGNPDLDTVIKIPSRPTKKEYFLIIKNVFRKYDLTVNVQGGDRPTIYSLFASHNKRVGILHSERRQEGWKRWLLDAWILLDNINTHTVIQNLKLADCLGLERHYQVIPPSPAPFAYEKFIKDQAITIKKNNVIVLHPVPRFPYKGWTFEAWSEVIRYLQTTEYQIVLSGGPGQEEIEYCQRLATKAKSDKIISIAGSTSLAILAELLSQAKAYIGPDTAVTHLAAASKTKTIVLLGPSNPMKWGAWPANCALDQGSPWLNTQPRQENDNVVLLQGVGDCVPCYEEGCDRHTQSLSKCLQAFPAERVIAELKRL